MRVIANRSELLPILDLTRRVAERGESIMSCALICATPDGRLSITATDYQTQVSASLSASVLDEGGACVNAATLFRVVAALPAGADVSIHSEGTGGVVVSQGRRRSTLPTMEVDAFPPFGGDECDRVATLPAQSLRDALQLAIPMASEDETRPTICGVSLRVDAGGHVVATSTNGQRVARLRRDTPTADAAGEQLVGKACAAVVARICDVDGDVAVFFGPNLAAFEAGGVRVVSRCSGESFPDVDAVLAGVSGGFDVSVAALDAALAGAMAIGAEAARLSPNADASLRVEIDGFVDEFDCDASALPAGGVGFNCRLLRDALAACRSDVVTISGRDELGPFIFVAAGDVSSDLFVVMPYRIG